MIETLAIAGYRSIRDLVVPLSAVTVVTGANGTGKSSFYRALRLLVEIAQGRVVGALAAEGGLDSTLWAGPDTFTGWQRSGALPVLARDRRGSVALKLGFASKDYGYAIDLGLPIPSEGSMFNRDPVIKAEALWAGATLSRRSVLARRTGAGLSIRDAQGQMSTIVSSLASHDAMMDFAADPEGSPEVLVLRERMRAWRFYDHIRTDAEAPARTGQIGTRTVALSADGSDLAAALQTIREIGDPARLDVAIADAFPGAELEITESAGRFGVLMHQEGLVRPLGIGEVSDGTLRYLALLAALMTPRPPGLMVFNEPETSLHPDLLAPLARLIAAAAQHSQVVVVTHATGLAQALAQAGATHHTLEKTLGETRIAGHDGLAWTWPGRAGTP